MDLVRYRLKDYLAAVYNKDTTTYDLQQEILATDKKIMLLQFSISIQQRMVCSKEILTHDKRLNWSIL